MKRSVLRDCLNGVVVALFGLLVAQIGRGQSSITYLSNIGQTPDGSNPISSDSWLAAQFGTGNDPGGYVLNSIQLGLGDASGSQIGFSVMIYSEGNSRGAALPGSSLGTLVGSVNPLEAGSYTFTSLSGMALSPHATYFIVVTAGMPVASGAYEWGYQNTYAYDSTDGWAASVTLESANGSSWTRLGSNPLFDYSQFAINATAAPEPGTLGLLALGGMLIGLRKRLGARGVRRAV